MLQAEDEFKVDYDAKWKRGIKSGCYIKNSDIIDLPAYEVLAPLRHINYDVEIVDSLAHVNLMQEYENPTSKFL